MTSNRLNLALVTQLILGLLAVLFLSYCFHFNADLSDEGFYLYYFQHGYKVVSFNFYYVFVSFFGELFSHQLIGYRYLSLLLLTMVGLFLFRNSKRALSGDIWLLPFSLSLMYFNLISTFSYNTMVLVSSATTLGLLIGLKVSSYKRISASLIGLMSFFVFSARFGTGIIVLMISLATFFLIIEDKREAKKLCGFSVAVFILCLVLFYNLWSENFDKMIQVVPHVSKSSHQGLVEKYLTSFLRFFGRSFIPPLILLIAGSKFFPRKVNLAFTLYLMWFVLAHVLKSYDFPRLMYYTSGAIGALVIVELMQLNTEKILFLVVPLLFYFSSSLGTNNNPFMVASFNCLLLYPAVHYLFRDNVKGLKIVTTFVFLLCLTGIYFKQYYQSYNSKPRDEQHFTSSKSPALQGIKIDQKLEDKLQSIEKKLVAAGFDQHKDKVVAYPNLPGVISYLGLKAYGNPWNVDHYRNSDLFNIAFFNIEPEDWSGRLFLYPEKTVPRGILERLPPHFTLSVKSEKP